jgi:hypothetical protein
MDLANSKEGSQLVIFNSVILKDKVIRRRFLARLNLPTYF